MVFHLKGRTHIEGAEEIFGPDRAEVTGSWRKLHN
jgi:hypothetical protein